MSAYIPQELRGRIRDRFGDFCAYCRTSESLVAVTFEIEHIVPRAAGGTTCFENLCLACPTCNRYKSDTEYAVDPVTGNGVLLFNPQLQEWSDHFRWDEAGTEIVGSTPAGRATIALLKMNRPPTVRARRMWVELGEHLQEPG